MSETVCCPCCGFVVYYNPELDRLKAKFHKLEKENERYREALMGILCRHRDGSDEYNWAEWDTVEEVLYPREGK